VLGGDGGAVCVEVARVSESYIVRIYRRELKPPPSKHVVELTGIVERTTDGERLPFHNVEELWKILEAVAPDETAKLTREPPE